MYTRLVESLCSTSMPIAPESKQMANIVKEGFFHNQLEKNVGEYGFVESVTEMMERMNVLFSFLEEKKVNYMYIATPNIDMIRFEREESEQITNWNVVEGNKRFQKVFTSSPHDYMRICDYLGKDYDYEFDASVHWTTNTAIDACACVVKELNKRYNKQLPTDIFDLNNYENVCAEEDMFLQGIRSDYDYDFKYLIPKKSGHYSLTRGNSTIEGTYREVFCTEREEWSTKDAAYHAISRLVNGEACIIRNEDARTDERLLIIGDSFCWPVYGYMSQVFKEVVAVWCQDARNVKQLIDENNPTVVHIMINELQFKDTDNPKKIVFQ